MAVGSSKHQVGGLLLAGDDRDVLPTHFKGPISRPLWDLFIFPPDGSGRSPAQIIIKKKKTTVLQKTNLAFCLQPPARQIILHRESKAAV